MGNERTGSAAGPVGAVEAPASELAVARAPEIRRLLLAAFDAGKRDLPWRGDSDPYRVWVSEVMLQQTRVETVIPYYKEWMKRFPDLDALAGAEEEQVLRVWQGLGYYSRARNLLGAARMVRESMGSRLPDSFSGLRALPGVGEYTAGAVASIAFGEAVPAVDGNVRRVLSRLFDRPHPGPSELRSLAGALVDPVRPGDFNEALMELGALVCTPRSPLCGRCPLEVLCLAHQRGTEEERPGRRPRGPVPQVDVAVVVAISGISDHMRLFLRRRPQTGLLAGMWEFPGVDLTAGEDPVGAALTLAGELGLAAPRARPGGEPRGPEVGTLGEERYFDLGPVPLAPVTHAFTHLKARYLPFLVRVTAGGEPSPDGRWLSAAEVDGVPIPVAQGRILRSALKAAPCGGA